MSCGGGAGDGDDGLVYTAVTTEDNLTFTGTYGNYVAIFENKEISSFPGYDESKKYISIAVKAYNGENEVDISQNSGLRFNLVITKENRIGNEDWVNSDANPYNEAVHSNLVSKQFDAGMLYYYAKFDSATDKVSLAKKDNGDLTKVEITGINFASKLPSDAIAGPYSYDDSHIGGW